MQGHFDIHDIQHLSPIALDSINTLSGSARYALVLTGLSQRALQVSSTRPGGTGDAGSFPSVMNALVATAKLEADLKADGCWDGKRGAVDVLYGGTTKVMGDDTRISLASAIVAYVQGPENSTPFASAGDLLGLLDTLSRGGISTGAGGCAGGGIYLDNGKGYDQVGPTVTFSGMLDPFVRGTIEIIAIGNDNGVDDKPSTVIKQKQPDGTFAALPDVDGDTSDGAAQSGPGQTCAAGMV